MTLVQPRCKTVSYGDMCFSVCAPQLWNSLPVTLRQSNSFVSFKKSLKTYNFLSIIMDVSKYIRFLEHLKCSFLCFIFFYINLLHKFSVYFLPICVVLVFYMILQSLSFILSTYILFVLCSRLIVLKFYVCCFVSAIVFLFKTVFPFHQFCKPHLNVCYLWKGWYINRE